MQLDLLRFMYEQNAALAKELFETSSDDFDAFLHVLQLLRDGEASKEQQEALRRLHDSALNSVKSRSAAKKARGRQSRSVPDILDGIEDGKNLPRNKLLELVKLKSPTADDESVKRAIRDWLKEPPQKSGD